MKNLVVNPEAFDVRTEIDTAFRDEIRLIIPYCLKNNKGIFKLMNDLNKDIEEIDDKIVDYYSTDNPSIRLRQRKTREGKLTYHLIKGFKTDKEIEDITQEEFMKIKECINPYFIRKDVVGVVDIDSFSACEEIIVANNKLYFSLEIETEDIVQAFLNLQKLLNKYNLEGDIITSPIIEYFYNRTVR